MVAPDGKRVVTAGVDGTVRVFDIEGKVEEAFVPVPLEKGGAASVVARTRGPCCTS